MKRLRLGRGRFCLMKSGKREKKELRGGESETIKKVLNGFEDLMGIY